MYILEGKGGVRKIDPSGIISTIITASQINGKSSGNGGPLSAAGFNQITQVTADYLGNLIITDFAANIVRKVNSSGIINTIAGNGTPAFSGDGGLATNAELFNPINVSFDNSGNMFITDYGNARVRKVNIVGTITTVAGNGSTTNPSDGGLAVNSAVIPTQAIPDNNGNLFILCNSYNYVRKVNSAGIISAYAGAAAPPGYGGYGGDGGTATMAFLNLPNGIALDNAGNLYISDYGNYIIRKVFPCPVDTPIIQIVGPTSAICAGTSILFTATTTKAGPDSTYQWMVDGVNSGTNSDTFSTSNLHNGSNVTCILNTLQTCATGYPVQSNSISLVVNPLVVPTISIRTTEKALCVGTPSSFSSYINDAGSYPSFQWLVNGNPVTGATDSIFVSSAIQNGNLVSCRLISSAICPSPDTIVSNIITADLITAPNTTLNVSASDSVICAGTQVNFSAIPDSAGTSAPFYQWEVNGQKVGNDQSTYSADNLANGDVVSCNINADPVCNTLRTAQSQVVMTVYPTPTITLLADTTIPYGQSILLTTAVTGPVISYQWTPSTYLNNPSEAEPTATPPVTTSYQVLVSTPNNCTATGKVSIGVFKPMVMPSGFTPNGDGINDIFRIPASITDIISGFSVFDRWGKRIFFTKDPSVGWDGTVEGQNSPVGAYVWVIEYLDGVTGKKLVAKGTVTLMR